MEGKKIVTNKSQIEVLQVVTSVGDLVGLMRILFIQNWQKEQTTWVRHQNFESREHEQMAIESPQALLDDSQHNMLAIMLQRDGVILLRRRDDSNRRAALATNHKLRLPLHPS